MAAVKICSDFRAQENKVCHCFHCFPIYLPRSADPMNSRPPGSSVYGVLWARLLEWAAISFCRIFLTRDRTWVSCTAGTFITTDLLGSPGLDRHLLNAFLVTKSLPPSAMLPIWPSSLSSLESTLVCRYSTYNVGVIEQLLCASQCLKQSTQTVSLNHVSSTMTLYHATLLMRKFRHREVM